MYDTLTAQRFLSFLSVCVPFMMLVLYGLSPKAVDAGSPLPLTLFLTIATLINGAMMLRNWNIPKNWGYHIFTATIDISFVIIILVSYAKLYGLPLSSSLKAPTANMLFLFLVTRICLQNERIMFYTGLLTILAWCGLVSAAFIEVGYQSVTHGYVDYLNSFKLLVGAEIERLIYFSFITWMFCSFIHLSRHDPMTRFLRRFNFQKQIHALLEQKKTPLENYAFLKIRILASYAQRADFDKFARIVGKLPFNNLADVKLIGRLTADDIGLVLESSNQPWNDAELDVISDRIITEFDSYIRNNFEKTNIPIVIGSVRFDLARSVDLLQKHTEDAITFAMEKKRKKHQVFNSLLLEQSQKEQKIKASIENAIAGGGVHVFYQPIIDLMANKPVGFEALLRLSDEHANYLNNEELIPIAEKADLVKDIFQCICEQVAQDAALIKDIYYSEELSPYINVNISPQQLQASKLVESCLTMASSGGLKINIELTESFAMDEYVQHLTRRYLSSMGYDIFIDDFGTGYSSLSRLHEMDASVIKIDKCFLRKSDSEMGISYLKSIVNLVQSTGKTIVQEGVETTQDKVTIMNMGIRYCQGYLFGKPMSIDVLINHLSSEYNISTDKPQLRASA